MRFFFKAIQLMPSFRAENMSYLKGFLFEINLLLQLLNRFLSFSFLLRSRIPFSNMPLQLRSLRFQLLAQISQLLRKGFFLGSKPFCA